MNKYYGEVSTRLEVTAIQDENATVIRLIDHRGHWSTGSSKRISGDKKNYPLGFDIALARALIKHGKAMLKEAQAEYERG